MIAFAQCAVAYVKNAMLPERDTWGSHRYLFDRLFEVTGNLDTIVEFGCGRWSTEYLSYHCDRLVSIETSANYLRDIERSCAHRENIAFHQIVLHWDRRDWDMIENLEPDLVFVDSDRDTRLAFGQWALDEGVPYVVFHDWERQELYGYDDLVWPEDYTMYLCEDVSKQTMLLTTKEDVVHRLG